eukprot:1366280-Pyramimonas_sp.AAC.1
MDSPMLEHCVGQMSVRSEGLMLFVSFVIQGASQWGMRVMRVVQDFPCKILVFTEQGPDIPCEARKCVANEWIEKTGAE